MLIGELSRRTGVNPHQLRYYEAQGLLTPVRGANGYREYGEDTVTVVSQIRSLLAAGLSTEDIEYLLPCASGTGPDLEPCDDLIDALRTRMRVLDERLESLNRSREALGGYLSETEKRAEVRGPYR
ncbi:MerR family transcriptional regulator [Actinorhabdospora filicis]|uniref:MerR family transcriptional regulator n=1 Tax=Actinorhabdospora filicis TaxID=1785913 RepID=A0A9W6W9Q8_9ACTN|nr:MerR family transcriptional regulator [Actinorhabdospora filicis]GLZ77811.1 MerR family transcriptional regulator [Actinorhabdospora filicis]